MVSQYTTLVTHLRLCIGPAREVGLSTGTCRVYVPPCKRKKKRKKDLGDFFGLRCLLVCLFCCLFVSLFVCFVVC